MYDEEGWLPRWPASGLGGVVAGLLEGNGAPKNRGRGRKKRKKTARSFGDGEWQLLCTAIEQNDTPEARVLEVMIGTGLRIGDVLRLTKRRLRNAERSGRLYIEQKGGEDRLVLLSGAPKAWQHLSAAWAGDGAKTVASLVSPEGNGSARAGGAAYRRVTRRLKQLAAAVGIDGRVNSHRLRRTVGVQALRVTEDVPAVAQLLGHRSMNTTMGYLDEARPDRVAELQQQLKEKFR